jgi:hypothetical protein
MRLHAVATLPHNPVTDQPAPGPSGVVPAPLPDLAHGTATAQVRTVQCDAAAPRITLPHTPGPLQALYQRLAAPEPSPAARAEAADFVRRALAATANAECDLPDAPEDLHAWMHEQAAGAAQAYGDYLAQRRAGAPRRYFSNRAHALYFLRSVAPTKLVDGAWLYGVLAHSGNPRMEPLVRTYLEELGDGQASKNHVTLYRQLLAQHGMADDLPDDDALYEQGLMQLALAWTAEDFLPEVIGFNLGYEQLPLHLLITAYELNELGIDPYYFTLHVTVDNSGSGHARQACDAVLHMLPPAHGGPGAADARHAFWQRVRAGSRLGNVGRGTVNVIESFDAASEATRIFQCKAPAGAGLHSDYARIGGRTVNEWLTEPGRMGEFLQALAQGGWIAHGRPAQESRLWNLLQGERAEMFGVFSPYELQVIHDWIRGPDSADGQAYFEPAAANQSGRRPSFRALQRMRGAKGRSAPSTLADDAADPDLVAFDAHLAQLTGDQRRAALVAAMGPALHWTPTGLHATRLFAAH